MAAKPRSQPAPAAAPPSGGPSAATTEAGAVVAKDLAARLSDPAFQTEIEQAIRELPPDRAAELVAMLEASVRRRRIELYGYLLAAVVVIVGMIGALLIMGSVEDGRFVGWIFLIPLALAGLVMTVIGKRAKAGAPAAKPTATRRPS